MPEHDPFGGHGEHAGGKTLGAKGPGGIPAWGYGVGIAGLVLAVMWYRNAHAASAATNAQTAATDPNAPGGTGTPGGGYGGGGTDTVTTVTGFLPAWGPPGAGGGPGGSSPSPGSNTEWGRLATDLLISHAEDPSAVHDAINDYLDGQPDLTGEERALVDLAMDEWGRPPQRLPVVPDRDGRRRRTHRSREPLQRPRNPVEPLSPEPLAPPRHPVSPVTNRRGDTREVTDPSGNGTGKTIVVVT